MRGNRRTGKSRITKTSFKPGQSGNPAGRPKNEVSITHFARELARQTSDEIEATDWTKQPIAAILARNTWREALRDPSSTAAMELWERIDGKVPTPMTGGDGGPMQVVVRDANGIITGIAAGIRIAGE